MSLPWAQGFAESKALLAAFATAIAQNVRAVSASVMLIIFRFMFGQPLAGEVPNRVFSLGLNDDDFALTHVFDTFRLGWVGGYDPGAHG